MSSPGRPPGPVNLSSSDRILTPEVADRDHNLLALWGGIFYHPAFVAPGTEALRLQGCARYIESDIRPAVSNVLLHRRPGIRVATLPLMFQYFGPIAFAADTNSQRPRIEFVPPRDLDFGYFSLPPQTEINGLPPSWRAAPQKTIALGNRELAKWGNAFRDDVKNKIRKARRERIEITIAAELPAELWNAAYSRKSIPTPIQPSSLKDWCDKLIAVSLLTIYAAVLDGRPVAFRGELRFGDYAYDWIAGSDPRYHPTGANQLLMAEIGNVLAKSNLVAWDLVGGEVEKIADFKKSFGASEVLHHHVWGATTVKGHLFSVMRRLRNGLAHRI